MDVVGDLATGDPAMEVVDTSAEAIITHPVAGVAVTKETVMEHTRDPAAHMDVGEVIHPLSQEDRFVVEVNAEGICHIGQKRMCHLRC